MEKVTIEQLHDAKIAKQTLNNIRREVDFLIDELSLKGLNGAYRRYVPKDKNNENAFNDLKNYSPIIYGSGISEHELRKRINEIFNNKIAQQNKVLDLL